MNQSELFYELIHDILSVEEVQNMRNLRQHTDGCSLLEHSIYTAYVTFKICDLFGFETTEAVRAALLHDFRLDDHSQQNKLFAHSTTAKRLASDFFEISPLQKNIIESHMWPITITKIPKSREAVVVNMADNYCAILEKLHFSKRTKALKQLRPLMLNLA